MDKSQVDQKRPFIGVHFECCGVYSRIYRAKEAKEYRGRCPKCLRELEIKVDPKQGKDAKFFVAT